MTAGGPSSQRREVSPPGLFCRGAASLASVNQAAVVAAGPARAAGHLQALVARQRITIFWGAGPAQKYRSEERSGLPCELGTLSLPGTTTPETMFSLMDRPPRPPIP